MWAARYFISLPMIISKLAAPTTRGESVGLYISHGTWSGAYSAFHHWKNTIAEAAGYTLREYTRPSGFRFTQADMDAYESVHRITHPNMFGYWSHDPGDPLIYLIAHHDDKGRMFPTQATPLADRLAELLPLLPAEPAPGHIRDWGTKTQTFIDGLRTAAARGEQLIFA